MDTIISSVLFSTVIITLLNYASAADQSEICKGYLWKILTEDIILIKIDSLIARQYVPSDYEIYVDNSSKAVLMLVNQNNSEYRYNGRDLGNTDEVLHWIRIIKPQDHRYIPGTELTLKTVSWFALFFGSSNSESRKVWESAGNAVYPINEVSLNRTGKIKTGNVNLSGNKSYYWKYRLKEPRNRILGINHELYYKTPTGNDMMHQIKAAVEICGWGSEAVLKVTGGNEKIKYLPDGKYNVNVNTFNLVWATITLGKELRQNI